MRFANWPVLFLLPLLFFFYRIWIKRRKTPSLPYSVQIPSFLIQKNPIPKLVLLRITALFFFILALSRPQSVEFSSERRINGIDIMMLLDVSASMNIEDLGNKSRLEEAKSTIDSFVSGRKNDRIGLTIFSGESLALAPPTLDYPLLLSSLKQVTTGTLQDGTAIGDGLAVAVSHLKESKAKSRVIILLTDGDNNIGQVDPATAGELAKGYQIRVYTIAIGREGRVKMPIRRPSLMGDVISYQWIENALNPEILKKIAEQTKGKFYRVTDATTLNQVFQEIDQLEKSEMKIQEKMKTKERFTSPLLIALFILLFEQIAAFTFWRFCP